ncbi:MAG TPA: hypothetical protein VEC14_13005 [Reyranellaceae bacterium]|nr:hypothetical protein [Reyranellaceae bacterium]
MTALIFLVGLLAAADPVCTPALVGRCRDAEGTWIQEQHAGARTRALLTPSAAYQAARAAAEAAKERRYVARCVVQIPLASGGTYTIVELRHGADWSAANIAELEAEGCTVRPEP